MGRPSISATASRTGPSAGTLWFGVALVGLAAAFLWAPVGVLCVVGAASCAWLVDPSARAPVLLIVVGRTVLAVIATVAASAYFADGLLPGQVDQVFYIETANAISRSVLTERTLFIDYGSIVDLHNRSYNVVLGWATALGRSGGFGGGATAADLLGYRLLNVLFSTLLVVVALRLTATLYEKSPHLGTYRALTVWGVGFMPYLTIYSQMVTRDVMIALLFTTFLYGLVGKRPVLTVAAVVAMYYTRLQFGLILAVGGAGWLLLGALVGRRRSRVAVVVALGVLAATAYGATFVLPQVAFVRGLVASDLILDFATSFPLSVLGLEVLVTPPEDLAVSRGLLLAARLVIPESIVLPLVAAAVLVKRRGLVDGRHARMTVLVWSLVVVYFLGYYVTYGAMFVRLISPFYVSMYVLGLPLMLGLLRRLAPTRRRPVAVRRTAAGVA